MASLVRNWVIERGYGFFPDEKYLSMTLTCARNTKGTDLSALKKRLADAGYAFDDGYGKIKGETFRIAHMGDMQLSDLNGLLAEIDRQLAEI
jgi:aspartate aminotransferase-like enzyme